MQDAKSHISVNLLPITFDLMTVHLFETSDGRKKHPLNIYSYCRLNNIKPGTSLYDLYQEAPSKIRTAILYTVAFDYRIKWGRYGPCDPDLIADLEYFVKESGPEVNWDSYQMDDDKRAGLSLRWMLDRFWKNRRNKSYFQPIFDGNTLKKKDKDFLVDYLRDNPSLLIYPINEQAYNFAIITQLLSKAIDRGGPFNKRTKRKGLDKAPTIEHVIPKRLRKAFRHAYMFAEISMPPRLMDEIFALYLNKMTDFIPFALLYQVAFGKNGGADYIPSLNEIGMYLGYFNSNTTSFVSHRISVKKPQSKALFPSYNFFIEGIAAEQESSPSSPTSVKIKKGNSIFNYSILKEKKAFSGWRTIADEQGMNHHGYLEGYYILDGSRLRENQPLLMSAEEKNALFHLDVASYTPQPSGCIFRCDLLAPESIKYNANFNNSIFLSKEERLKAFEILVETNPVTRPSLKLVGGEHKDSRWNKHFDEFRSKKYQLNELIDPLYEYLLMKSGRDPEKEIPANRDFLPRKQFRFSKELIHLASSILNGEVSPQDYGYGKIKVKLEKTKGKLRYLAKCSERQKTIEKIFNALVQCAIAYISRENLDRRLTNSLPGTAPSLHTGMNWAPLYRDCRGEFILGNLDIKNCFDRLRVDNPEFTAIMTESRDFLIENGFASEAVFLWKVFNDYFVDNLSKGNFPMEAESDCIGFVATSVPTGFVMSSCLLYFLVIPLCSHLEKMRKIGKVISWELVGDDLLIASPANISDEDKIAILKPWFRFADRLGLDFHYHKNIKKRAVDISQEVSDQLFESDENAPRWKMAWTKRPWPDQTPFQHGGVTIKDDQVSVVSRLNNREDTYSDKAFMKGRSLLIGTYLGFMKRQKQSCFEVPAILLRAWQQGNLSTGEIAKNLHLEGEWPYPDLGDLPLDIQCKLILEGERAFVGRFTQDKKHPVEPRKFKRQLNRWDYQKKNFSGWKEYGLEDHPNVESIPTGKYFFVSGAM